MKYKKNGFSGAEMLLSLTLAIILITGVLLTINTIHDEITVHKHSSYLATIHSNIKERFRNEEVLNYNTEEYARTGLFPESLVQLDNYWVARTYTGAFIRISKGSEGEVRLHYNKIDTHLCVRILQIQKEVGWNSYGTSHGTGTTFSWAKNKYDEKGEYSDFVAACEIDSPLTNVAFGAKIM